MDYPKLQWQQWQKAVCHPMIRHHMFWIVYFIFLTKKLYQMMMIFETMIMLANLAIKLTMTVGIFVIDTWTPESQHDTGERPAYCVVKVHVI